MSKVALNTHGKCLPFIYSTASSYWGGTIPYHTKTAILTVACRYKTRWACLKFGYGYAMLCMFPEIIPWKFNDLM